MKSPLLLSLTFIIGLSVLTGCSTPVKFEGKSENWTVNCTYNSSAKTKSYDIRYIGDEETFDGSVSYAFKDSSNFQESGESKVVLKIKKIAGKSTVSTPVVDETQFSLEMKWNGHHETIPVERTN
ncbi:hypothetical protein [Cohnella nanjingensis]|uniref:Lipoprotein n=1 Tax=Cohnella nanjingensis TaxID=1387779 RepID=A0A7X0RUF2_9BACL|nr:hypothetical protein [Cohnella nanjingensis]MBB6673805.1 hypothetical protein [Cohnella nanjingensis]